MIAAIEMRLNSVDRAERDSKEAGFSIVEVLGALAIASIALIAYSKATTTGLMHLKAAAQDDYLTNEVENIFEQLTSDKAVAHFPRKGQFGASTAWYLDVKRLNERSENSVHEYEVSLTLRPTRGLLKTSTTYRTIIVLPQQADSG